MTQPLQQHLPTLAGVNFAPTRPLIELRERNGDKNLGARHYITDALKEKYSDLIKREDKSWREMISIGQLIALFIEGKQILDWNPYTNAYTPRKLKGNDPNKIKAVNFMQYYCTNWQAKWGSSNPDITLSPLSNRDQDIAKARKANTVVNHLERKIYGSGAASWYQFQEGLLAQVFGWYGNRVRACKKSGRQVPKPILEDQEVKIGKGWGKCYNPGCGYSGNRFDSEQISQTDQMPICPECGSTEVYFEPAVTQIMPRVTGYENVTIPTVIAEQLPFAACRWNPKFRAEDSSWFIYEQEVDNSVIKRMVGDIRIPAGGSGNELGLEVMRALGEMGGSLGGRSDTGFAQNQNKNTTVVTEMYLSADDLHDIIVKGDERTISGRELPAGKRLSEAFPDGACAVMLNASLLIGLYAEHHSNSITSGVYHMKPLSGTGRGVADAVEVQKRFNREDSNNVLHMDTRARPATLHLEGAISPANRALLGRPDVDIPVKIQNFPEIKSIQDVIMPLQGQSIPGDVLQYTYQHLQSFMQLAYHITDFSGGLGQRVNNKTATGAEILDSNAEAIFSPALDIKAEVRVETGRKAFNLWCELNPVPTFLPYQNPTKSGSRGIEIAGEDVKGEYEWGYVPGSQLPKNRLTRQRQRIQFYGMFGGMPGYFQAKLTNPQEVAEAERDFDMDFASDNYDEIGEVCRTRFEMGKTLLGQAFALRNSATEQFGVPVTPPDPMTLMPMVRPMMLVTESNLREKALWFSNLLDTNEGLAASDEERSLISAFVQAHKMLADGQAIALQKTDAEISVAAREPIERENAAQQAAQMAISEEQRAAQTEEQQVQQAAQAQQQHDQQMEAQGAQIAGELMKEAAKPEVATK
jgi:hypothetical protein